MSPAARQGEKKLVRRVGSGRGPPTLSSTQDPETKCYKHRHSQRLRSTSASDDDIARGVFQSVRSRDRNVVLVKRTIDLRCWEFGMGGDGEGLRKGRSVYEQPGTKLDRIVSCQRRVSK
jgi:hypothetical protein